MAQAQKVWRAGLEQPGPDLREARVALAGWQRNETFGSGLEAPSDARSYAVEQLSDLLGQRSNGLVENAALIVSELVTNAVRADSNRLELAMTIRGDSIELRVCDDGPGWPQPRDPGIDDTSGRGLLLVAALADEWGVDPDPSGGKAVWARLPLGAEQLDAVRATLGR